MDDTGRVVDPLIEEMAGDNASSSAGGLTGSGAVEAASVMVPF